MEGKQPMRVGQVGKRIEVSRGGLDTHLGVNVQCQLRVLFANSRQHGSQMDNDVNVIFQQHTGQHGFIHDIQVSKRALE